MTQTLDFSNVSTFQYYNRQTERALLNISKKHYYLSSATCICFGH